MKLLDRALAYVPEEILEPLAAVVSILIVMALVAGCSYAMIKLVLATLNLFF